MPKSSIGLILTACIDARYKRLYNTTLKLYKTASSIGFIKKFYMTK